MPKLRLTLLLSIGLFLAGCAQYHDSRGVDVGWQQDINSQFTAGKSTRKDVLDKLGPPSQVIALGDETILYYLYERSKGNGLVLVIYNRMEINTRYDRAIFFFDENDVLTEFSARNGGEHGE